MILVTITFPSVESKLDYLLYTGVCQKYQISYLEKKMAISKMVGLETEGYVSDEIIPNVAMMAYNSSLLSNRDIHGSRIGNVIMKGNKFCYDSKFLFGYYSDQKYYFNKEDVTIKTQFLKILTKSTTFNLECGVFDRVDFDCNNLETKKDLSEYSANLTVRYDVSVTTGRDPFIGIFPTSSKIEHRFENASLFFINYNSYSRVMNGLCGLNRNLRYIA